MEHLINLLLSGDLCSILIVLQKNGQEDIGDAISKELRHDSCLSKEMRYIFNHPSHLSVSYQSEDATRYMLNVMAHPQ